MLQIDGVLAHNTALALPSNHPLFLTAETDHGRPVILFTGQG